MTRNVLAKHSDLGWMMGLLKNYIALALLHGSTHDTAALKFYIDLDL